MSKQAARQRARTYNAVTRHNNEVLNTISSNDWSFEEVLQTSEIPDLFYKFIEAKAVHDFHYDKVNNGYLEGTREHKTYAYKINELMEKANEI